MKKNNLVAQILFIIGLVVIVLGFIGALISAYTAMELGEGIGIISLLILIGTAPGFVAGMIFIGLAEIIELMYKINRKLPGNDEQIEQNNESEHTEDNFPEKENRVIAEIDMERIHKIYKDNPIVEIIQTPYEDYCIVKTANKASYDIVELGGFTPIILTKTEQQELQNRIKDWYENEYKN